MHYPNVQSLTRGSFRVDRYVNNHTLDYKPYILQYSSFNIAGITIRSESRLVCRHIKHKSMRWQLSMDIWTYFRSLSIWCRNEFWFHLYGTAIIARCSISISIQDNNPSNSPTPIHLIDEKNTDPQSPFYTGYSDRVRLMPLAKLTIRRSAVYASKCPNDTKTTTVDELDRDKRKLYTSSYVVKLNFVCSRMRSRCMDTLVVVFGDMRSRCTTPQSRIHICEQSAYA
jgi:hypothetical protein